MRFFALSSRTRTKTDSLVHELAVSPFVATAHNNRAQARGACGRPSAQTGPTGGGLGRRRMVGRES